VATGSWQQLQRTFFQRRLRRGVDNALRGQAKRWVKWTADGFTAGKAAQHVFYAISFA
jgi:hypothetical protein